MGHPAAVPRHPAPSPLCRPSTRAGARAAGVTDWQLRHPDVVRLSRDTYLPRADAADLRTRVPAVLMTAPADAVISHQTAAAVWRVDVPLQAAGQPVHLTVPLHSKARHRRDRRLHRGVLPPRDVEQWWGMPVTSPARTWRDLAAVLEPAALLAVTDQLLDVLCRPADLERALQRAPSGRGAARCRLVLPVADPRVDSPMESVTRWLLHEAGLPRPTLQYRALDDRGRQIGFGDMAWPEFGLVAGARAEPARRGGQPGPSTAEAEPARPGGLGGPAVQLGRRHRPPCRRRRRRPPRPRQVSPAFPWPPGRNGHEIAELVAGETARGRRRPRDRVVAGPSRAFGRYRRTYRRSVT